MFPDCDDRCTPKKCVQTTCFMCWHFTPLLCWGPKAENPGDGCGLGHWWHTSTEEQGDINDIMKAHAPVCKDFLPWLNPHPRPTIPRYDPERCKGTPAEKGAAIVNGGNTKIAAITRAVVDGHEAKF